jgi:hypothetical protein
VGTMTGEEVRSESIVSWHAHAMAVGLSLHLASCLFLLPSLTLPNRVEVG